jgi:hypothetical protein
LRSFNDSWRTSRSSHAVLFEGHPHAESVRLRSARAPGSWRLGWLLKVPEGSPASSARQMGSTTASPHHRGGGGSSRRRASSGLSCCAKPQPEVHGAATPSEATPSKAADGGDGGSGILSITFSPEHSRSVRGTAAEAPMLHPHEVTANAQGLHKATGMPSIKSIVYLFAKRGDALLRWMRASGQSCQ